MAIARITQWLIADYAAGQSADPARAAQVQAYAEKNVPAEARKPFAGVAVAIRQNQYIATQVLPELDRFMASIGSQRAPKSGDP